MWRPRVLFFVLIIAMFLGACDAVEPEGGIGEIDATPPPGLLTFGIKECDDELADMDVAPDGGIIFCFNRTLEDDAWGPSGGSACIGLHANGKQRWAIPFSSTQRFLTSVSVARTQSVILCFGPAELLMRATIAGGIAWSGGLPASDMGAMYDATETAAGELAIAGTSWNGTEMRLLLHTTGLSTVRQFVPRPVAAWEVLTSISDAGDGTLIIAGRREHAGTSPVAYSPYFARVRIDSLRASTYTYSKTASTAMLAITRVRDGSFFALAAEYEGASRTEIRRYWVSKWTVDGTPLWDRSLEGVDIHGIWHCSDGGAVLAGSRVIQGQGTQGVILKIEGANGKTSWLHTIERAAIQDSEGHTRFSFSTALRRVCEQPDGRIVAAGSSDAWGAGAEDVFLLRLNQDGSTDTTFGR